MIDLFLTENIGRVVHSIRKGSELQFLEEGALKKVELGKIEKSRNARLLDNFYFPSFYEFCATAG